jgi:hypothetical protein
MPFTAADPFIDRTDLSDYLGRDVTADDGALPCINFACDICRNWAGQTFNRGTYTETYDGTGTDALMLTEMPVNSVSSVYVSDGETPPSWITAGTLDYALNGNGVLLAMNRGGTAEWGSTWPARRQSVMVTYDAGYDTVPSDVRGIALAAASRMLVQGPALFESLGDVNVRYAIESTALTPTEQLFLYRHRRR